MNKVRKIRLGRARITDYATYLGVVAAFLIVNGLMNEGALTRSFTGQLVPICCYIVMAVSLNLTVGILGELSLGHAGFMSVGAFTGVVAAMSLQEKMAETRKYREAEYEKLIDAVYPRRGWNLNGVPTIERVKDLGIDFPEVLEVIEPLQ